MYIPVVNLEGIIFFVHDCTFRKTGLSLAIDGSEDDEMSFPGVKK